ncbi:hypothetical protein RJ640_007808 [Escallonia rubra]|uniref:Retrotransposon gag domain-containing protein n=1 Tax=Escallonia rubra TaxID=112253 RepID=A0AA88UB62_9ASTE|nr:hypothetical protein RJ640_007808 [Escallonia rubra]
MEGEKVKDRTGKRREKEDTTASNERHGPAPWKSKSDMIRVLQRLERYLIMRGKPMVEDGLKDDDGGRERRSHMASISSPLLHEVLSPNVKEAMESDFMRIAQHPNETIMEYEERFAQLSRFASHVVQDESHRARKFREGCALRQGDICLFWKTLHMHKWWMGRNVWNAFMMNNSPSEKTRGRKGTVMKRIL